MIYSETLIKEFENIKKMGWIKSKRNDYGGIGRTFEELIGVKENEFPIPDFGNIEIKTKRAYSKSYTNLFNSTPTGPHYHEVENLRIKYGYPDKILKNFKVLNTSIYANSINKVGKNYFFKLTINKEKKKIYLTILNSNLEIIENSTYWDFDDLEEKLYRKMKYLAFIKAYTKKINNDEYFKYYEMKLYKLKEFNDFIKLIEKGIIRINLKIGIFRSGNKKGNICDHGTSFCIKENDLDKLYNLIKWTNG